MNSLFFVDAINSDWLTLGNGRVGDVEEFLEPWIQTNGYPAIHVGLRQGGVILTQVRESVYIANVKVTYTNMIKRK